MGRRPAKDAKEKRAKVLGLEFGEKVLWKHQQVGTHQSKLSA